MMKKRTNYFNINLFAAFFLAFNGYYVALILVSNLASNDLSRLITVPIRLMILMSFYLLYKNNSIKSFSAASKSFILFSILYIVRIGIEFFKIDSLYMSESSFLMYFFAFVLIPFILLSKTSFDKKDYDNILLAILISSAVLSIATYFYYGQLLGSEARISQLIDRDANSISPLALSYGSALGIGVGISYLLTNKLSRIRTIFVIIVIVSSSIPFFLGASRGGILAVVFPIILYFIFSKGVKSKLKILLFSSLIVLVTVYITGFFGTYTFDRLFSISDDIAQNSASASRIVIWKDSLSQFINNPFFGNSLESKMVHHHPHNIIVEILMSTGIIGFTPFVVFLFLLFRKSVQIIKLHPQYFWIVTVFFQGFTQSMFSGAIWGASWLAISAALVIGFPLISKSNQNKNLSIAN